MGQRANDLRKEVIQFLFTEGCFAFPVASVGITDSVRGVRRAAMKKGISDILACYNGMFVAIEIKIGKDHLHPEQMGFLKNVASTGGISIVATEIEQFKKVWYTYKTQCQPHSHSVKK